MVRRGNRYELNLRRQLRELIRAPEGVSPALYDQGWSAGAQQFGRAPWAEQRVGEGQHSLSAERTCRAARDLRSCAAGNQRFSETADPGPDCRPRPVERRFV